MARYIKINGVWKSIQAAYKKVNDSWTALSASEIDSELVSRVFLFGGEVSGHTLSIAGPGSAEGESCSLSAVYDSTLDVTTNATWSILSGSGYATIGPSAGVLTILSGASEDEVEVQVSYGGLTTTKTIEVTYLSGTTTETEVETVVDPVSGETTTTTTTTVTNEDGSSSGSSTTVVYDNSGDVVGTSETETTTNSDGSSTSSTINYDASGDPTSAENISTDTSGNVNTQEIEYNQSGDPVVTGYTIDTSGNEDGAKEMNGTGVNTKFYAFDMTDGFVLNLHFTIDFSQQPANQNENHHNVLTMKRASPEPWYGLQLRQSGSNKYIQLGTQFSTGSNTNTQIQEGRRISSTIYEYNVQIIYDPNAASNNFTCKELISNTIVFQQSKVFPDLPELQYLTVCLGYALDTNGDPFRYSNIDVMNFTITKLSMWVENPVISCTGQQVTITCPTSGTSIYYRLGQAGNYVLYSSPITINEDTIVEAYAVLNSNNKRSPVVTETCEYDSGVENPIISCNGEEVTITSETPSADIYYRIGQSGSFSLYDSPIQLSETVVVEAYAELNGATSDTVRLTCTYSPRVLVAPVITCDGETITITCETNGADIYYRLDHAVSWTLFTAPISISTDTFVEAYSSLNGDDSSVVSETCEYVPLPHNYANDYLTFQVLTAGTIAWQAFGSGYTKTIEYSVNNGSWTSITAAKTTPATFSVAANDTVRFRGSNNTYAGSKANYDGFEGGTATFNIEGNIMSLVYGDNFIGNNTLSTSYVFCSIFKKSNVISAENLILPATLLPQYAYRAMFSLATDLEVPPALPATDLGKGCYWYMFEGCAISSAPDLLATTLPAEAYGYMFTGCANLNYIKCLATSISATDCLKGWVTNVAQSGTFVKDGNTTWTTGVNGVPTGWTLCNDVALFAPTISYDGDYITLSCQTPGASIYYNLNSTRSFTLYTTPIPIVDDTFIEVYSTLNNQQSQTVSRTCEYVSTVPFIASNRNLTTWRYNNTTVTTPYSVNRIDGHSSSYAKGTFNFETSFDLRSAQPTYLWFQHADQTADIYVDNVKVETHWGGYTSFFSDISNYVHQGTNNIKVALCNTTRNTIAPAAGDFNFNATLGNVKLFSSPVLPDPSYGYDGFHVTSTVTDASATIYVKTSIPLGASVVCSITDGTYTFTDTKNSTGSEMTFTTTISNPHLWNGTEDPHLYTITLEIYKDNELYHRYQRPYGLRYYSYVFNDTTVLQSGDPYTGFLLNGSPYLLRGVCMHDDLDGKANALTDSDYTQEFSIIQELGCNFLRLAHYPHPKEVYDRCDQLGIIVQTEAPCVNKLQSTMPADYYTHLTGQYADMVNQHYNHPCILFWGLSNETTTDDKDFGKTKIEGYTTQIKALDPERWVGYVMSHSYNNPSGYYNNPNVDWFGCNIYTGWYIDKSSNNPTSQLNTRVTNTITSLQKPLAFSEYGCGGTQHCHSEDPQTTTTKGNYERHDIEYQMWLHEGHIAAIRNFPQLLFTAEWQLFDIAVSNRNEGYTVCLDGETTSTDDNLRRLNNKGLVERDHITKKDTFYIYKAEWNPTPFVHICGKDYTRKTDRVIKCYTNDGSSLSLYVNNTLVETAGATDNIVLFTSRSFNTGDVIRVDGSAASDTFTF